MLSLKTILNDTPISPCKEMGAYEALWVQQSATFKTIADKFRRYPDSLPSDFVNETEIELAYSTVMEKIGKAKISDFGIHLHGTEDSTSIKRSTSTFSGDRLDPTNQLLTIHLNPLYKASIKDKHVIVVDDCTTYGISFAVAASSFDKSKSEIYHWASYGQVWTSDSADGYRY